MTTDVASETEDESRAATRNLEAIEAVLLGPALSRLDDELTTTGLTDAECAAVRSATESALHEVVRRRTVRVLLVELHAARITGRLTAPEPRARWREWAGSAARPEFWASLTEHYPSLLRRLGRVIDNRCGAALLLAHRFAADRGLLGELVGAGPGALVRAQFDAGDSHQGGQTVAILHCEAGRVVYKPRSVAIDAALADLLPRLLPDEPVATRIAVPRVIDRDGYGWAEFVAHRFCADEVDLRHYYRNLGHWLALVRMLGGCDLHAGNLIAAGPVPTVIDCETFFAPQLPAAESGYGQALDRAVRLLNESVLSTGLLPDRGSALGWRGIDSSATGSLPDEQPVPERPVIVDAGTDLARVGYAPMPDALDGHNLPSPQPELGRYWDLLLDGFDELSAHLRGLDRSGHLEKLLAPFADLPIRVLVRSTESYAELGRMLWHPESLHDEPAARGRAADVLAKQASDRSVAPGDPAVIQAEIGDLLHDDVPFFTTTPRHGRLTGPAGTGCGVEHDLIDAALERWRTADLTLDRQVIRSTLVSAYLNDGWLPELRRLTPSRVRREDPDRRRRTLAAGIIRDVVGAAVRAEDGTATWIAPVLDVTGWLVRPLGLDLYGGAAGVAVLLAAYAGEVGQGRADPVPDVAPLLDEVLRSMRLAEDRWAVDRASFGKLRPEPVGGYLGLGSRIWGWLLLARLGAVPRTEAISRSRRLMDDLATALPADDKYDLVQGMAGAVVPLLRFAECTGEAVAAGLASEIGARLVAAAEVREGGMCWPSVTLPQGIGGLAHGATGIGWALDRLAMVTGDAEVGAVARAAFNYEEALYDPDLRGWRDLRYPGTVATAWCHGAGGIGVAAVDRLDRDDARWRDVLHRAATACWSEGLGWNHTLCHGDLGAWEVIDLAITTGVGPPETDREVLAAHILSSLEEHGPVSGMAREAVSPGLIAGLGGVAYQLLRMHPECALPSVLLPDPGPAIRR